MTKPVHYRARSRRGVYCCGLAGGIEPHGKFPQASCLTTDVERVTCEACMREIVRVIEDKRLWLATRGVDKSSIPFNTWTTTPRREYR